MHRDTHITNIRNLNLTTPGECDGFCVNGQRVAVPLAVSGGQIAVFEVNQQLGKDADVQNFILFFSPVLKFFGLILLLSALSRAGSQTRPCPPSRTL